MASLKHSNSRGKKLETSFLVPGASLVVAALVVVVLLFWIQRGQTRMQILSRDAALIEAVARMEFDRAGFGVSPFDEAVDFALGASELNGIIGLAVFDEAGETLALVPDTLLPRSPYPSDSYGESRAVWHPRFHFDALFVDAGADEVRPLVEIHVRLPGDGGGAARAVYWMDGTAVEREFAELDRHLVLQAVLVILAFAAVGGGLVFTGYRRLGSARREIVRRHRELERANAELLLAAKASALGALSANLVHGLKNPVAGIERYLENVPGAADAREAVRRVRAILDNTTHMLRGEGRGGNGLSFTVEEILEEARAKVAAGARGEALRMDPAGHGGAGIPAREANLILLILVNLIENAFEAAGPGAEVDLSVRRDDGGFVFSVRDNGPGIPAAVRERLFEATASTKAGGTGLGLAISRQLARQMEGDLELADSSSAGSEFSLKLSVAASADGFSSYSGEEKM
ncbi:MAG: sensor histidine kinase [Opitutales bacterium]|nr:sensor histidine kinase [Opitutales bacterium]